MQRPAPQAGIATNSIEKNEISSSKWPNFNRPSPPQKTRPPSEQDSSSMSPIAKVVLGLVKNYIGSYMGGLFAKFIQYL